MHSIDFTLKVFEDNFCHLVDLSKDVGLHEFEFLWSLSVFDLATINL